jgi:hypothetical protein
MMKTGMNSTRVNKMCKCHLVNAAKALIVGMRNNIQYQWMIDSNKTINGIVDYLPGVGHVAFLLRQGRKTTIAEVIKLNLNSSRFKNG